jgi:hypothetical protein
MRAAGLFSIAVAVLHRARRRSARIRSRPRAARLRSEGNSQILLMRHVPARVIAWRAGHFQGPEWNTRCTA